MPKINDEKIKEILSRNVADLIVKEEIEKKLRSGKKLLVKHGIDPSSKDLHLGHAVIYWKLKSLQDLGHKIIFLIGSFTGRFGDPTTKLKAREFRSKKEVLNLAKNYLKQVGRILDLKKTEVRFNHKWYDKMPAEDLLKLMSHFSVAQMLERDMFQERIRKNQEIGLHEIVYPLLQGYDSVMLKSDLTIIGQDQIFNELQGRRLQQIFNQAPQDLIATKILIGLDGERKMSQSLNNYIGIVESAQNQFGKVMSIPDKLIWHYFEMATLLPEGEINDLKSNFENGKISPKDVKSRLAYEIVTLYHGKTSAEFAQNEFDRVFKEHKLPSIMSVLKIKAGDYEILDLLLALDLIKSKSEGQRLIQQKGLKIDNQIIDNWDQIIDLKNEKEKVLQIGKKKFGE